MLYKDRKAMIRSPEGKTDVFDIVTEVLQGDTLAAFLFIISLDFVPRKSTDLMREDDFTIEKPRSRRCPAEIMTVSRLQR